MVGGWYVGTYHKLILGITKKYQVNYYYLPIKREK